MGQSESIRIPRWAHLFIQYRWSGKHLRTTQQSPVVRSARLSGRPSLRLSRRYAAVDTTFEHHTHECRQGNPHAQGSPRRRSGLHHRRVLSSNRRMEAFRRASVPKRLALRCRLERQQHGLYAGWLQREAHSGRRRQGVECACRLPVANIFLTSPARHLHVL